MLAFGLILTCIVLGLSMWVPLDREFTKAGLPESFGNSHQFELNFLSYSKLVASGKVKAAIAYWLFFLAIILGAVGFAVYLWSLFK